MSRYKIEGGHRLNGSIHIHGAKNAALPILAATVINAGKSVIHNCPILSDVKNTIEILEYLGCKAEIFGNDVYIDSSDAEYVRIPLEIMNKTRISTLFAGALSARFKTSFIAGSGGCHIGSRPIDIHLDAFRKMGMNVRCGDDGVYFGSNVLHSCRINLPFPSVGATENIMLAASRFTGTVLITNAAREPEIVNLAEYLSSIGVSITGAGSDTVLIRGTGRPKDGSVRIIADRIVAATYACCTAACGGEVYTDCPPNMLSPVISVLRRMGASVLCRSDGFYIKSDCRCKNIPYICTGPYPNFPTDCQPLIIALMSVSDGKGAVREKIFENRFGLCERLSAMGADIAVNGRTAVIRGVKKLKASEIDACDLRCGAALTVAALAADGTSIIGNAQLIERGYEDICADLKCLGAKTERID